MDNTTQAYPQERPEGQRARFSPEELLKQFDTNQDCVVSKSEAKGPIAQDFDKIDTNKDGSLSQEELKNMPKPQGGRPGSRNERPGGRG